MTSDQQELLVRRRAGFEQWLAERLPVLHHFAAALELPQPSLIVNDPERYLPAVDAWLRDEVVEPADWGWVVARIGYFAGEVLIQRLSGCWVVCDAPTSRYFGRYVVGRFHRAANPAAIADAVEMAAACLSEPPGRSLTGLLAEVTTALQRAEPLSWPTDLSESEIPGSG